MTRDASPGPTASPADRGSLIARLRGPRSHDARGPGSSQGPSIIEPPGRMPTLGLGELWRYRSILVVLTRRNLMVRYRQTIVGVGWVLLQPLAFMLVFTIVFGLIGRVGSGGVPYPVFYLCALWAWHPLMKVVNEGTQSILTNLQLVTRVYVPRTLIPLSVAAATLVDLLFMFLVLQFILLLFGYLPSVRLFALPILVGVGYLTVIGVAYLLAALNTRYRDAQLALPFLIQLWFFLTPIIYPATWVPARWEGIYYLNPMALVVTGSRWIFADMEPPPPIAWPLGIIVSVLSLVCGYLYFRKREPTFADDL